MSLAAFFTPASVAVVGATANTNKLGYAVLKNVVEYGFTGGIYPVNPAGGTIHGHKAVPSIGALRGEVDLALICIPSPLVPAALTECAEAGVKAAIILASGFGETGPAGRAVEAEMQNLVARTGIRLIGPNCMGVTNMGNGLNASLFWSLPRLVGPISFISQSGAMGGLFFAEMAARGLGVAKFASVGNAADVEHAELLEYMADDPETGVIALFIESIQDGPRFLAAARRVAPHKPVVVLKAGRTEAGSRAAASHTGSMAGQGQIYKAAFTDAGVLWTESTEAFFDTMAAMAAHRHRLPRRNSLAVITISGGPSVLAADACEEAGLTLPGLGADTRDALQSLTPGFSALGNPVDLTPQVSPEHIPAAVDRVLADAAIDGAIFINVGLDLAPFGPALQSGLERHQKPIVAVLNSAPSIAAACAAAGIPVYNSPLGAVTGYAALVRRRAWLDEAAALGQPLLPGEPYALPPVPDEFDAKAALAAYGLPITREERVSTPEQAAAAASRIGYPVALKLCQAAVTHKTEVDGVRLGLKSPSALAAAWNELAPRFGSGPYLVQEMAPAGIELILGGKRDPSLGPMVAFGPGGILTELIGEVSLAPAPFSRERALRLIARSRVAPLFSGYRARPGADADAVAAAIVAVGQFMAANPEVAEVDVNPVIAGPHGCVAVDALVIRR